MCSSIEKMASIQGSGKGVQGWFPATHAVVSYDHPIHAMLEQSVIIDIVNPALGPGARVGVELTPRAARDLAEAILAVVERAEAGD